ncbi:hypothetical protein, partial [Aeromonas allosaccharophila]|uniref:hypothetical protein n=1 Tax=Aeromonas allosaccharophila TaxID=656 RepID=UPI003D25E8C3
DTLYPPPVFTFRLFRLGDNYSDTGGLSNSSMVTKRKKRHSAQDHTNKMKAMMCAIYLKKRQ